MGWYEQATANARTAPAPAPAPVPVPAPAAPTESLLEHFGGGSHVIDYVQGAQREGMAGMLDSRGMTDRSAARRELAPMFNVQAHLGTDAHTNTITPEEFDKVSRTYSNVRLGRGHLRLAESDVPGGMDTQQRADTMHDIANIMQTSSGRQLIDSLSNQRTEGHDTTISYRHRHGDEEANTDNAEARYVRDVKEDPAGGADTSVTYVPGDEGGIVRPHEGDSWLPMRSDVTLYHELTHAMHMTDGTMAAEELQVGLDGMTTPDDVTKKRSEAQAVGLYDFADGHDPAHPERPNTHITENNYRAERLDVAASGVGVRTTGGVDDANITDRNTYVWHRRPGESD